MIEKISPFILENNFRQQVSAHLLLAFNVNGFTVFSIEESSGNVISIEKFNVDTKNISELNVREFLYEYLKKNYYKTFKLIISSEKYTLIPEELYSEEKEYDLLKYVYPNIDNCNFEKSILDIKSNRVAFINSFIPWQYLFINNIDIPIDVSKTWDIIHFIKGITNNLSYVNGLFVNVLNNYIDIVGFVDNEFKICNRYLCSSYYEFSYQIHEVIKAVGLDINEDSVYLSGLIPKHFKGRQNNNQSGLNIKYSNIQNINFPIEYGESYEYFAQLSGF